MQLTTLKISGMSSTLYPQNKGNFVYILPTRTCRDKPIKRFKKTTILDNLEFSHHKFANLKTSFSDMNTKEVLGEIKIENRIEINILNHTLINYKLNSLLVQKF